MPLKVSDIITQVNSLIDDKEADNDIIAWINDGLSEISTATNTILPEVVADTDSLVIPDRWVRKLIIPFAAGRAKQKDSSQFEYTDAYNQFFGGLSTFIQQYQMPDDYKILQLSQDLTKPDVTTYTTVSEDTLGALATAWNTTVDQIKSDNNTDTFTIKFLTEEFEGDMYSEPAFPWMGAF